MSKYIDLLREHQGKSNTSTKQEKIQAIADSKGDNPYRKQADNDASLLDDMELLLEELDNPRNDSDKEVKEEEDMAPLHNLLATEAATEQPTPQHDPAPDVLNSSQIMGVEQASGFDLVLWLEHVKQLLKTIFVSAAHHKSIDIQTLEQNISIIFDQVQTSPQVLDRLELELKLHLKDTMEVSSHDPDLVQKSVMMMLYSIRVGLHLKRQAQELLPCTIAAMLQHLGMAMVAESTREKVKGLSDDEVQQINDAKQKAQDYLNQHQIQHKQLMVAISYGDERYDGSGPQGLSGRDIPWVARLTNLLSTFEALVHFRPYRTRLFARDAIRNIVNHHKKEFDPEIMKALIESMSLYPVGTYIQLNTGEIGQVIHTHSRFVLRPVVDINMDRHGGMIDGRTIDLTKQHNLMIEKCLHHADIQALKEGLKD